MSILLVQSCSASKQETDSTLPALDLYTGYFYKIIKKAIREGELREELDLRILSAEHGLLEPSAEISHYDRRMNQSRAAELRDSVHSELRTLIQQKGYNRVIVNMGTEYLTAVEGFDDDLDIETQVISGGGIGVKGHILKRVLRGDDTALEVAH